MSRGHVEKLSWEVNHLVSLCLPDPMLLTILGGSSTFGAISHLQIKRVPCLGSWLGCLSQQPFSPHLHQPSFDVACPVPWEGGDGAFLSLTLGPSGIS